MSYYLLTYSVQIVIPARLPGLFCFVSLLVWSLVSLELIAGTLTFGVGASGANSPSAQAIQFANGRSSFGVPFQLTNARTSQTSVWFRGASYYFTFNLPETASQALTE